MLRAVRRLRLERVEKEARETHYEFHGRVVGCIGEDGQDG